MTEIEDKTILQGVYYERYKNRVQNRVIKRINNAVKEVKKELNKTDGVYTRERYKEVIKSLRQISKTLKENVSDEINVEDVVSYELEKQSKLLRDYGGIDLTLPSAKQIMTAAEFKPFVSKTFSAFLDEIDSRFYDLWDSEVRNGYLTGLPTSKIVKNIVGSVASSARLAEMGKITPFINSVTANTRTALQSFANETRKAVYKENENLFKGYKWVSTLDRRTCLVCGQYDGKVYKSMDKVPDIPQHMNCRCLVIPVIKDNDESFTDERVSENGYVDSKITYQDWLKKQNDDVLKDVLGKTRFEIYKQNGKDITTFISDNKELTLEELKNKLK